MALFLLAEQASGYALFEVEEADVIASQAESMQTAMAEYARFCKMVKLKAFAPFRSAEHALENANVISEGGVSEYLSDFLETNLPLSTKKAVKKKENNKLGVSRDPKFKSSVSESLSNGIQVMADDYIEDLLRGVRMHFHKFVSGLNPSDQIKSQLGLAHSYSRSKIKFNVHKSDNMIIQSIALLDQLDKDINTFAMRVREWYSWHFPELIKIITDNIQYARVVGIVKNKNSLTENSDESQEGVKSKLNEIINNEELTEDVITAAKSSMGTDISDVDLININMFATRVVELAEYRQSLHHYLTSKMSSVAPNLAALIGDQVGARLISHAGSLTNLAKYPASTVQILGAEKALFRALKTKGKTPKYGLLYHSTFIGRAKTKNKGRISRYLANKCSIASRMDCFSDVGTDIFGKKLRDQVEERLKFYETGTAPRKNLDVMQEAIKAAEAYAEMHQEEDSDDDDDDDDEEDSRKKTKASSKVPADDDDDSDDDDDDAGKKKKSSAKKIQKEKKEVVMEGEDEEEEKTPKKKSKSKVKKEEEVVVKKEEDIMDVETPKSGKKNKKKKSKTKEEDELEHAEPKSSSKKDKKKKRKSIDGGVEKKKKKRKA